jgi:hypothetical protein
MIFYSDELITNIIDTADVNTMLDEIEQFIRNVRYVVTKYSIHTISHHYSNAALSNVDNVIVFYCFDQEFSLTNCPSIMIYNRHFDKTNNEMVYYVLFTCTKRGFRNMGYASKLFDGLKERIVKEQQKRPHLRPKMVLSSLEEAVLFYENYGFRWTRESLDKHPVLMQYETYHPEKEYFIMEYYIES